MSDEQAIGELTFVDTDKIHEALAELISAEMDVIDRRSFQRGLEWALRIVRKHGILDDDVICNEIKALLKH